MSTGAIVILSYPDTVVRPAYTEFSSKVWPMIGVGSKHAVQAGHAALLLLEKASGNVDYYDFGRYITSFGFGRVRSKKTDVELEVPLQAKFKEGKLTNIQELLLWLDAHPEKTHGDGRLVAGLNSELDYDKAKQYIEDLQNKKEVPYGAFVKGGSNCARFVTDTLLAAATSTRVRIRLKTSNQFTPSPIGNVIKGSSDDLIHVVENQKVNLYTNRSILKEYFSCFLNKFDDTLNTIGTEKPNTDKFYLENATWLGGIGSGAWFQLSHESDHYQITRYTSCGKQDFKGVFACLDATFDIKKPYDFVHPTNCKEAFIVQNQKEFLFRNKEL
ncbi:DUF6695 family protein [Wenyingzhuangia sp. IMCC45574]